MLAIGSPFAQFFDRAGRPLERGSVYIGVAGNNPETTPVAVFWDAAGTQPAPQPLKTSNGYISRSGKAAQIYTAGDYSITVRDKLGAMVFYEPSSAALSNDVALQSAIDQLRTDLANSASASKGAGMVAYNSALSYPDGSVGQALRSVAANAAYRFIGAGIGGDDTAAIAAYYATVPEGAVMHISGVARITSPVTFDRRVGLVCDTPADCIYVECGATKDGVIIYGTSAPLVNGINNIRLELNVYGPANACEHAVVLQRLDRSHAGRITVRAGSTAYNVWARGCLIVDMAIDSSVNYPPPVSPYGSPLHHMLADNFGVPTTAGVACTVTGWASPAVVTWNAHGRVAGDPVVFTGTTKPPSPFILGKPYFVLASGLTANSFQLAEKRNGTAIITTTAGTSPLIAPCTPVASNSNTWRVNFEGGTNGYVQAQMPGEGNNQLIGEIEGCAGYPFYVEDCITFQATNLRMEANALQGVIKNCEVPRLGPAMTHYGGGGANSGFVFLQSCQGAKVDGYYGNYNIDAACFGTLLGEIQSTAPSVNVCLDPTAVAFAPQTNSLVRQIFTDGPGHPPMAGIYHNPYFDWYSANGPTAGPPDGVTTTGFANRANPGAGAFPGNPTATSMRCSHFAATLADATTIVPTQQPWLANEYVSIMIAVLVEVGFYGGIVYGYNGAVNYQLGVVPPDGAWHVIRAAFPLIAGNNWSIKVHNWDGVAYHASQLYVGGINIVRGPLPPSALVDTISRRHFVSGSVAWPPPFVGAEAYVNGTGKLYKAKDTVLNTDWIMYN